MNWTEGSLARHSRSRAKKAVLNRQKQYFAKARTKHLNGSLNRRPVTFSFLQRESSQGPKNGCSSRATLGEESGPSQDECWRRSPRPRARLNRSSSSVSDAFDSSSSAVPRPPLHLRLKNASYPCENVGSKKHGHGVDSQSQDSQAKRRRLLNMSDWAGLTMQRPPELEFHGNKHSSTGPHWTKQDHSVPQRGNSRRRVAIYHDDGTGRKELGRWESGMRRLGNYPIRVQIGSQDMHSISDCYQATTMAGFSVPLPGLHSPIRTISSHRLPESRQETLCQSGKQGTSSENHSLSPDRIYEHGPCRCPTDSDGGDRCPRGDPNGQPEGPTHVVYSASVIHEPTPCRAGGIDILHWSPSAQRPDDTRSMCVEVDKPRPKPPTSQIAENDGWKAFLGSCDGSSAIIPLTRSSSLLQSPRFRPMFSLSQSPITRRIDHSPSSESGGNAVPTSPKFQHGRSTSNAQFDIITDPVTRKPAPADTGLAPPPPPKDTRREQHYGDISAVRQTSTLAPVENHCRDSRSKAEDAVEENEDWLRFVFGSNDGELEETAFAEALHQVACELRPSDTSMSADDMPSSSDGNRDFETVATWGSSCGEKLDPDADDTACNAGIQATGRSEDPSHRRANDGLLTTSDDSEGFTSKGTASASHVATVGSPPCLPSFRFAVPQLFIGRLRQQHGDPSDPVSVQARAPVAILVDEATKRGRRRNRKGNVDDGRTNIRALPDFDGDPIE